MNLNDCDPKDVIDPAHFSQYEEQRGDLWQRIITMNTFIEFLEEMSVSPSIIDGWTLNGLEVTAAFDAMAWAFHDKITLLGWQLVFDTGSECHTIRRFKNNIRRDWIRPEFTEAFDERLKAVDFQRQVEHLEARFTDIRHNWLAHRLFDENGSLAYEIKRPTIQDFRSLFASIKALFDACCFGHEYAVITHPKTRPGMKSILDLTAKAGSYINEPEDPYWPSSRPYKSAEEIDRLNAYRRYLRMPEVN